MRHPRTDLPVLDDTAALPAGSGGISVDVRPAGRKMLAPQIGIDGQPALYGFGRALIPVSPGRHIVEAQDAEPVGTTEVTVSAGEVIRLVHERAAFRAADAAAPAPERSPLLRLVPRVASRVLALTVVLVLAVLLTPAAVGPPALIIPLFSVLGIAGYGWLMFDTARAHNALLAPRRSPSHNAGPGHSPHRLGDDAGVPVPSSGRGAVLLDLGFWASATAADGAEGPALDTWITTPHVRIDGRAVVAGWARCWYPLAPGMHDIEVTAPAVARTRITIAAGETATLGYHAQITVGGACTATLS